jgi:thioredoxin-related protein
MGGVIKYFLKQVIPLLLIPYFASGVDFDLDKLVSDANRTAKPILLFLHKDGCGFCEKMIFDLEDKSISKIIQDNFIFVDINRDDGETISFQGYRGTTRKFLKKLGVELYPTMAFLDGKGEFIYHIVGYRNPTKFKAILNYIRTGAYRQVTFEEFEDELHTN